MKKLEGDSKMKKLPTKTIEKELSKSKNMDFRTLTKVFTQAIAEFPPDLRDQFNIQLRFQGESVVTDGTTGTVKKDEPKASMTFKPVSKSPD